MITNDRVIYKALIMGLLSLLLFCCYFLVSFPTKDDFDANVLNTFVADKRIILSALIYLFLYPYQYFTLAQFDVSLAILLFCSLLIYFISFVRTEKISLQYQPLLIISGIGFVIMSSRLVWYNPNVILISICVFYVAMTLHILKRYPNNVIVISGAAIINGILIAQYEMLFPIMIVAHAYILIIYSEKFLPRFVLYSLCLALGYIGIKSISVVVASHLGVVISSRSSIPISELLGYFPEAFGNTLRTRFYRVLNAPAGQVMSLNIGLFIYLISIVRSIPVTKRFVLSILVFLIVFNPLVGLPQTVSSVRVQDIYSGASLFSIAFLNISLLQATHAKNWKVHNLFGVLVFSFGGLLLMHVIALFSIGHLSTLKHSVSVWTLATVLVFLSGVVMFELARVRATLHIIMTLLIAFLLTSEVNRAYDITAQTKNSYFNSDALRATMLIDSLNLYERPKKIRKISVIIVKRENGRSLLESYSAATFLRSWAGVNSEQTRFEMASNVKDCNPSIGKYVNNDLVVSQDQNNHLICINSKLR